MPSQLRTGLVAAAVLGALAMQGCGGADDKSRIQATARGYYAALARRDVAAFCHQVTPAFWSATVQEVKATLPADSGAAIPNQDCQRGLDSLFQLSSRRSEAVPHITLTGVEVHGKTARANLVGGPSVEPARFIKGSGGAWRIDCCVGAQLDQLPRAPYRVPSTSMLPTFKIGQIVTVDNTAMRAHPPALGDIVVFHPPRTADTANVGCPDPRQGEGHPEPCGVVDRAPSRQRFIKRVVGLPGDRLAIVGGHVARNGIAGSEPFISPCQAGSPCDFPKPIVVPPATYYLLGDNRGESYDSRFWGPVKRSWIMGLVKG